MSRKGSGEKLNFKRVAAVMMKEFIHIKRDSRSLFIALLAPVILLVLYGYAVTFDIKYIDLGVIDKDRTADSRSLINKFTASGYFEVYEEGRNSVKANTDAIKRDRIRMILEIPKGFSTDLKRNREVAVQVIADGSDANTANVAIGYASIIINTFSRKVTLNAARKKGLNPKRIPAIIPEPRVWYNPELKSQNFIVPGLIAILMMLIAAMLTSLTVVREKERGTFEQLVSTPIRPLELMAGKLFPYVLIGVVDVVIVVVAGLLWFKVPFRGDFTAFMVFSFLFLFCAMGLGLFISAISKTQTIAVMGTLFATMLPSILLSGFVFPISSMPAILQAVTYLIPARYFLTALRTLFLKADVGLYVLIPEALYLLFFGAFFLFLSSQKFRKIIG